MSSVVSESSSSKLAKWSLIFGIAAVALLLVGYFTLIFIPFLGWIAGVLALIWGIRAMRQPVKLQGNPKTWATLGTVIGVISLVYLVVSLVITLVTGV
jgi:hypothetical protein